MQSGFDKDIIHSPGGVSDGKVKVDAADVAGYLSNKLVQGSNIVLTVGSNGIIINAEVQTAIQNILDKYIDGHVIQSDGLPVFQRNVLDFKGAAVTVSDDPVGNKTTVEIFPTDGHRVYVQNDNAVPQRAGLKFVGGRVIYSDDPSGDKTVITIDGGYAIQDEGIALPYQPNLNFIGDAVTVTDDVATTSTLITINKHIIQDEGGSLPTRTHIDFVGGGITATDDAEGDKTIITLAPGVAGAHIIQGDGVPLAGRANLNFIGLGVELQDDPTNEATVVNVLGGGNGGLRLTPVSTPTVAALNGNHYVCNGVSEITLPIGVNGYVVGISDQSATFSNFPVTINATTPNTIGDNKETALVLDRNNACVTLGFVNGIWVFLAAESFNDTGVSAGVNEGFGAGDGALLASAAEDIEVNSAGFSGLLSVADTTVQLALQTIDGLTVPALVSDGNKGSITVSNAGNTWDLNNTAVTPGSYNFSTITVDATGRITSATTGQPLPTQTGEAGKFLTTNGTVSSWATVDAFPTQTGESGKFLTTNGTVVSWAMVNALPVQTGEVGKYLTTDGTTASWSFIDALPTQTGEAGKFLTTNGTLASWVVLPTGNLVWQGSWDNATNYLVNDIVYYNGSAYIAVTNNPNHTPGIDIEWELLVAQGAQGTQGIQGIQGETGLQGIQGIQGIQGDAGVVTAASGVTLDLVAEPVAPAASKVTLYADTTDGKLYTKDAAGVVTAVGSGAGGSVSTIDIYRYSGGV